MSAVNFLKSEYMRIFGDMKITHTQLWEAICAFAKARQMEIEQDKHFEVWKDVVGYEGLYQVSNFGNVKSLDRIVNKPNGVWNINLKKKGNGKFKNK